MVAYKVRNRENRLNANNSSCPKEHVLNNYLLGALEESERIDTEKHIANCHTCLYRISEAYEVLNESKMKRIKELFMKAKIKLNMWLIGSIVMFLLSFLIRRYFIQFLAAAMLLGLKWIIDNRNTRMLIMIYDAWKRGGKKETDRILESLDSRMKR